MLRHRPVEIGPAPLRQRPAVFTDCDALAIPELLCRCLNMAWVAQVAGVMIIIASAQCERGDMIHHVSLANDSLGLAMLAHVVCSQHPPVSLCDTSMTPEAFGHVDCL